MTSSSGKPGPAAANHGAHPRSVPVVTIAGAADLGAALADMVAALPATSGCAYAVLCTGAAGSRAELRSSLARIARMPVLDDGTDVRPDHIYIVGPDSPLISAAGPLAGHGEAQGSTADRLRLSEKLVNSAMERAGVGVAIIGEDRRYAFANRAYTHILGLGDDIGGRPAGDIPGSPVAEQIARRLDLAFEGKPITYDLDRQMVNGEWHYFTVAYEPMLDAAGLVGQVLVVVYDISNPRAAAQRIAESEEHLRLANEAAGIGTFAIDVKSGLVQYSPELTTMLGVPGQSLVKVEHALARIHRDDVARVQWQFSRAQRSDSDGRLRMEFRFVRPGGEVRWMTWNGRVEFANTPAGRVATRIIGACVDITHRKRAEAELRGSEARYRSVVEGSLQGIVIQQNERIVYANSAMARIFGFDKAGDIIGKSTFDDYVAEEERALLRERTAAVYRGEAVDPHPGWRGFRRDGSEIWVAAMAHLAEWQGQPAVVSFYLDVTERKLAEQKLNETLSLMQFASVAGRMGSWHFNPRTGRLTYSDEGLILLGIDKATWTGTLDEVEAVVHPDDIEHRRKAIADAIAAGSDVEFEFRNVHKNGDIRWMMVRGHVMRRPDGRTNDAMGVILDITERKRAEDRQKILIRELDHRVKNALANMQLVMERSREKSATVDEFKAALEGRLMSMARTHSQLSKGGWTGVSLDDIVREALLPYASGRNTTLDGPDVVLTPAASQAVAMTVSELVTNAAKYGALSVPDGHVAIHWTLSDDPVSQAPMLVVEWRETGGPMIEGPGPEGYGSSVIRGLIPYELRGSSTELIIEDSGVQCRIAIPAAYLVRSE